MGFLYISITNYYKNIKNNKMEKEKTLTTGKVFAWIFGVLFILTGFANILSNPVSGILFIIASLFILPPSYKLFREKFKLNLSRGVRILISVIFIIIAGSIAGGEIINTTNSNNLSNDKQLNSGVEEYEEVAIFTGKGNMNTESFYISGDKVKITATTTGGSPRVGSYSSISLEKENRGYIGSGLSISTEGTEEGYGQTIYRNLKEGNYYINVITGVNWQVKVEQTR